MKKITKLNGGSESISVSLPGWIIELIDHVCELHDLNRSVFFKRASKRLILELLDEPDLWDRIYSALHDGS